MGEVEVGGVAIGYMEEIMWEVVFALGKLVVTRLCILVRWSWLNCDCT
jgi:hypothetical protein